MKTCPYAISGLLSQSEFVASVLDGCTPVKDYSTLVACREEDCGRYALCNPQSTQENQHDKKSEDRRSDMDYLYDLWISQRSYNILKRVVIRIGWEAANSMSIDSWLKEKGCGRISASEIWNALHGNKDDNA